MDRNVSSFTAEMAKVCSACETTVERHLCHKNRYGEYICRQCQLAGIKFTWPGRWRYLKKWALPALLVFGVIAALFMGVLYLAFSSD